MNTYQIGQRVLVGDSFRKPDDPQLIPGTVVGTATVAGEPVEGDVGRQLNVYWVVRLDRDDAGYIARNRAFIDTIAVHPDNLRLAVPL